MHPIVIESTNLKAIITRAIMDFKSNQKTRLHLNPADNSLSSKWNANTANTEIALSPSISFLI